LYGESEAIESLNPGFLSLILDLAAFSSLVF